MNFSIFHAYYAIKKNTNAATVLSNNVKLEMREKEKNNEILKNMQIIES